MYFRLDIVMTSVQVEFLRHTLRFDVMEANSFCASLVREFGYDVLDLHYHFRCLIHQ